MERKFTSVEILQWENNELAIERAVGVLKDRLSEAPVGVLNDVLQRCNPQIHDGLIDWITNHPDAHNRTRLPRAWSPKRNRGLWVLYAAADLDRPDTPPT